MSGRKHPNLVGWWQMENNLLDWSGEGNDASVFSGTHGYAPGIFGRGRDYSAGGDSALSGKSFWGANSSFTISCWCKTDSTTLNIAPFGFDNTSDGSRVFVFLNRNIGNRAVFFLRKSNNTQTALTVDDAHPVGQWFHIAISNDDSTGMRMYINGVQAGSISSPAGSLTLIQWRFGIGFRDTGDSVSSDYIGLLDDLRIYNAALSESDIQRVYRGQQPARVYA